MKGEFPWHELTRRIKSFIDQLCKDNRLISVYLFGSYASGRQTHISDVDVAVLLDKTVKQDAYFDIRLSLMAELSRALDTDKVDLVILNESPYALAYRVIRDGQLLFMKEGEGDQHISFKERTLDRYFDYQPVYELFSGALLRRLREGSFGGR